MLTGIGAAALQQGDFGGARSAFAHALELADTVGVPTVASRAQVGLSQLAIAIGNAAQAVVLARQAADSIHHIDAPADEAKALAVLADAYAALPNTPAAEKALAQANALRACAPAPGRPDNPDPPSDRLRHLPGLPAISRNRKGTAAGSRSAGRPPVAWRAAYGASEGEAGSKAFVARHSFGTVSTGR